MSITPRGSDQYMIRFPEGLRDRLKDAAKANGRSMNTEVIQRLEASFQAPRELDSEIALLLSRYIDDRVKERIQQIGHMLVTGGAA